MGRREGSWGGARDSVHRRGTSEPELLPLHTQRTGHPWAQRPRRPAQRGADKQGPPVLTPSGAHPSSSAVGMRNVAYEPSGLWTLVEAPPDLSRVHQGHVQTSEACGEGECSRCLNGWVLLPWPGRVTLLSRLVIFTPAPTRQGTFGYWVKLACDGSGQRVLNMLYSTPSTYSCNRNHPAPKSTVLGLRTQ